MEDAAERAVVMVTFPRHSVDSNHGTFARSVGKMVLLLFWFFLIILFYFIFCYSNFVSELFFPKPVRLSPTDLKAGLHLCVDKRQME